YSVLSYGVFNEADFSSADLKQADLHRIVDIGTIWTGANLENVKRTDADLATGEDWQPPKPQKHQ
ncbi:MAG: pentapeptide repeat-containing protein, partial [Phycisphaerae bacterium]